MKKIAIDIDDTLTESRNGVRKLINQKLDIDLSIEAYSSHGEYWGYYERVWAEHGLKDKFNSLEVYEELHFDQNLTPLLPGAEFAVKELLNKFNIVLITSRDKKWQPLTEAWLKDQFGDLTPEIYFCSSHTDKKAETKGQICKRLGAEWLIDDNVEHCISAKIEGVVPVLFGIYGWHYQRPVDMINLHDWPAVLEYFDSVS